MKKYLLLPLLAVLSCFQARSYNDHRFHNVDSLETVMAGWTADGLAKASGRELENVANDLEDLMYGFLNTNSVKSEYYARMLLSISERMGWLEHEQSAAKIIGQLFWAKEKYDSAAFFYGVAMDAIEKMPVTETGADPDESQRSKDDALSIMYGTLGNLFSIQDSTDLAMEYYARAGVLFDKYGWDSSNAVLYGNMGETMRVKDRFKEAEEYYMKSMEYARQTGDSLLVAGAYKGLGSLYFDTGRTSKAMRFLNESNKYFADHEDEELRARLESLEYTQRTLLLQKKRMSAIILLLSAVLLLTAAIFSVSRMLKRMKQEKSELEEVLEGTVEAVVPVPEQREVTLKPKEKQILGLIAGGHTNMEIADIMCLSPETIKWYKKKLFAMFDATNSAELVRIVTDRGLL